MLSYLLRKLFALLEIEDARTPQRIDWKAYDRAAAEKH